MLKCSTYVPKGGVGKTTSTAHLGVAAAKAHDLDVLLVDLAGAQNDLATQFGLGLPTDDADLADAIDAPISAVFGDDWEFISDNIPDVTDRMVFETDEGVDLIPADPGLGGADNNLANVPKEDRYGRLDAFLREDLGESYDLVLMDLPGKEDNITLNALFATEDVIAPLKPGEFERNQLGQLADDLQQIADDHDVETRQTLVFATMVDHRTRLADEFRSYLEAEYPDVAGAPVPSSQNIGNAQADGKTLFALPDDRLYDTGIRARDAYRTNTDLLLDRL